MIRRNLKAKKTIKGTKPQAQPGISRPTIPLDDSDAEIEGFIQQLKQAYKDYWKAKGMDPPQAGDNPH